MSSLLKTAISAALSQDWEKAISANQTLLKENKDDINCLNRLAHAYTQLGKLKEAKKLYKKILSLDKYNIIAAKNMDKLDSFPKSAKNNLGRQRMTFPLSPALFIEEPGKTKTVSLRNTAPAGILSHLNPGDPVVLFPKKHSVDIRTVTKVYLGALPDDFAFRLLRFLKAGYEYAAFVKNSSKNSVNIFIREIKRAKRFKSQPSFLAASPLSAKTKIADFKAHDTDEENEQGENIHPGEDEV